MEEQDLFPQITSFTLPNEVSTVLRSQGFDVTKLQKDIDSSLQKGGKAKSDMLSYAMDLSDRATGSRTWQGVLEAAQPMTPTQATGSFGQTSGTQNFFGNLWNNSIPAVVEGAGKLLYGALPALFDADEKQWNERNKAVEDMVSPMMTYVDESFKSLTPVEWNRESGSLDLSNLANAKAWANISSQVIGFLLPTLATAGAGAALRAAGVAGKATQALNMAGGFGEIAEGVAAAGKIDRFGRALVATDMLTSTLQMFPAYQKEGLDNGLSIGQATAFALPTAIAAGLVEIIGGEALAKGLGFTSGQEGKLVMRDLMQMNVAEALRTVRTGKFSVESMQEVLKGSLTKTLDDLGNPAKLGGWQRLAQSRIGRAVVDQGFAESSEEAIQEGIEDMAKAIYNATTDKNVKSGQGKFNEFDAREFATNALFGAFLGGIMGTGMGMFHKSPKVFDQTLFSFINAEVKNKIQRNQTDFTDIVSSLKAFDLSQQGLDQGVYDATEKEAIDRKIEAMARVAYDFQGVKEFTPSDRLAMFNITNIRDQIGERGQQLQQQIGEVEALKQSMSSMSSSEAMKASIDVANMENQLGGINPQTGKYKAQEQLEYDTNISEQVFAQVATAIPDANKRKGIGQYIDNELIDKSSVNRTAQRFALMPDGSVAVSQSVEGRKNPIVSRFQVTPIATEPLAQKIANNQGQVPDIYTPTVFAQLEPIEGVQSYDYYQLASESLRKTGKPISDENLTQNLQADAAEVEEVGKARAQDFKKNETPVKEAKDWIARLYRYYKQIVAMGGAQPIASVRDFETFIGYERSNPNEEKAKAETKGLIDRLDESVRQEAIELARQYVEGYDGQNLPTHWKIIYDTLGSIKNLKDAWVRIMGNADDYPFRYEAKKDDTTAQTLDQYVTGLQMDGYDIDEQDVIDFMQAYPSGVDRAKTEGLKPVRERFKEITGKTLNFPVAKRIVDEYFKQEREESQQSDAIESDIGLIEPVISAAEMVEAGQILGMLSEEDIFALLAYAEQYQKQYPTGQDWVAMMLLDAGAGKLNDFPLVSPEGIAIINEAIRRRESTSEEIRSYSQVVNQVINEYERKKIRAAAREAEIAARAETASDSSVGGNNQGVESAQPETVVTNEETSIIEPITTSGSSSQNLDADIVAEQNRLEATESIEALQSEDERLRQDVESGESTIEQYVERALAIEDEISKQLDALDGQTTGEPSDENPSTAGIEAFGEDIALSRSQQLDAEAEARRQRLRDLAQRFSQAGRGQASASLIGVTPEQIGIAAEMLSELTALGINRFEKAVVWLGENVGTDWLGENFDAFKAAYGAVKFVQNDGEDLNAASKMTLEDILSNPESYLPITTDPKPLTQQTTIEEGNTIQNIVENESVQQVGTTSGVNTNSLTSQLALFEGAIGPKTEDVERRARNAKTPRQRREVAKEAESLIRDIDAILESFFDNSGIRPNEITENGDIAANRKVKESVGRLSRQLAKDLGFSHEVDNKGKSIVVQANIAPAGGEVKFKLWSPLVEGQKRLGIYVSVSVQRDENDNLLVRGIMTEPVMYRVIEEGGREANNNFAPSNISYGELKTLIENELKRYGYNQSQSPVPANSDVVEASVLSSIPAGLPQADQETATITPEPTADGGIGVDVAGEVSPELQSGPTLGDSMGDPNSTLSDGTGTGGDVGTGIGDNNTGVRARNVNNFTITPDVIMVPTGEVGKVKANIEAIRTMKRIVEENRPATEEEKQILVQYVGWGGLAEYLNTTRYEEYLSYKRYIDQGRTEWVPSNIINWHSKYGKYHTEILSIMTEEELKKAQGSTLTAYYTDRNIISSIWAAVERMGIRGGRVLESSMGTGHFLGLMPEKIKAGSEISGVELDSISGQIAKLLYPDADIRIQGFEEFHPELGSYDLVIGNVPFGGYSVYDSQHQELGKFPIHNYFIGKSAKLLRPGGIMAVITTSGTLDAANKRFRAGMYQRNMTLVSAVRLPSSAFSESAGTEVTSDILFFQKYQGVNPFAQNEFLDTILFREAYLYDKKQILSYSEYEKLTEKEKKDNADKLERISISINSYFSANPDNMLGEMKFAVEVGSGGLYRADQATLYNPNQENVKERLQAYVESLPQDIVTIGQAAPAKKKTKGRLQVVNGKLQIKDGEIQGKNDVVKFGSVSVTKEALLTEYAVLKNLYISQLAMESDNDPAMGQNRVALKKAYDDFTKKYGRLSENPKLKFIEDVDIEFSTVQSIESVTYTKENNRRKVTVVPSAILTQRVIQRIEEPMVASTLTDAIDISRSFRGGIDTNYIAQMLNVTPEQVTSEIIATGQGFMNPSTSILEHRNDYLSGDVRKKYQEAVSASEVDPRFSVNAEALQAILPPTIPISIIDFRLGSTWVPEHYIERFIAVTLGTEVSVRYNQELGQYIVGSPRYNNPLVFSMGTKERDALELIEAALNSKEINIQKNATDENGRVIYDKNNKPVKVKDTEAIAAATEAKENLDNLFVDFVKDNFKDQIEVIFNDTFNSWVEKEYSLPVFDSYPGANPSVSLRDHQKRAVERIKEGDSYLAHSVGTGKTFTAITSVMEMKRLGRISKALLTVQNSTVEQFRQAFNYLYPSAIIYVPDENDRKAENRKRFLQRIASNNYDAIIIPQSFLEEIPDSQSRVESFIEEEVNALLDAMYEEEDRTTKNTLQKKISELRKRIEARRKKQADRQNDDILTFEQLGIDMLILDEAHAYKRLGLSTRQGNIKGIDTAGSERALSALMKAKHVQAKSGRTVMMSGTPISNTMAEAWTIMRFISPEVLEDLNITTFDQFATAFGRVENSFELTTTGNFKSVARFSKFINVPQLASAFRRHVDVVLTSDVREFTEDNTIPKLKIQQEEITNEDGSKSTRTGPGFTKVILPQTLGVQTQLERIREVLEDFEEMTGAEKKANSHIPLVMFGQAKKATIDLRLLSSSLPDEAGSKTNRAVSEILRIYQESNAYKGAQLVFADLFQSPEVKDRFVETETGEVVQNPEYGKKRFNLFEDIKEKLVQRGIPESEIAIVPEDKKRRQGVFDKVKTGEIRVLLGTSERMGVGVNVQDVLVALHHLDAPQRPTDFEQRNGRILRQGNTHADMGVPVEILTYGVEKTLDATAYQRLAIKQKFIDQVLKGEISDSEMADVSDEDEVSSMSFDQMMATLSGSQYAVLYTQAKLDLSRLLSRKKNWERSVVEAQQRIETAKQSILVREAQLPAIEAEVNLYAKRFGVPPKIDTIEIKGKKYTEKWESDLNALMQDMGIRYRSGLESKEVIRVNGALVEIEAIRSDKTSIDIAVIHYQLGNYVAGQVNTGKGFSMSFPSQLTSFYGRAEQLNDEVQALKEEINVFQRRLTEPFKEEQQVAKLQARVEELKDLMERDNPANKQSDETKEEVAYSFSENLLPTENTTISNLITQLNQRFPDVAVQIPATEQAFVAIQKQVSSVSETSYGFYDRVNGRVVLNPAKMNANTPIHEFGHVWMLWARNTRPDLLSRGMELISQSAYYRKLKDESTNPASPYAGLSDGQLLEEALAIAIGNQGELFVTNTRKNGFKQWLSELFDSIKDYLGIKSLTSEQLQNITLDRFVKMVAADILMGEQSDNAEASFSASLEAGDLSPDSVNEVLFSFTQPSYDFATSATNNPNLLSSYNSWSDVQAEYRSKLDPAVLTKKLTDLTAKEREDIKALQAEYGYKYLGNGFSYLDLTESTKTFFTPDGKVSKIESFGLQSQQKGLIAQSALDAVVKLYNEKGWVGNIVRVLVDKFMKLTNVETISELLDDGTGLIKSLITETKRLGGRNKSYVSMVMAPLRNAISEKAKQMTTAVGVNDIWSVERVAINTYAWDETLGVVEKTVEVPTDVAMSILLTAETQEASFGGNSIVVQDRFLDPNGQLLKNDRSVLISASRNQARGAKILQPILELQPDGTYKELDGGQSVLLHPLELENLRKRFNQTGTQQELELYQSVKDAFNNRQILGMIKEENDLYLNPNSPFVEVVDASGNPAYYPINSNDRKEVTAQDKAGMKINRPLEDAQLLIERNGISNSVTIRGALDTLDDYQYRVENIVEHGRLAHNLKNVVNALRRDLGDNKLVSNLSDILLDRTILIEDYRKYKADRRAHTQFQRFMDVALNRYTSSVFRLNFGIALKQLATFYSASGQSLLKDEYLFNAKSYMNLFSNSRGIFTDTLTGVGQDVIEGTDVGFKDKFGNDSSQAELLRDLLGENIQDDVERETWRRQMATVIDRVITANNQYIGGVDVDQIKWNAKGLGLLGKIYGKADAIMEDVGMAPIKIGDRAVILAYYQAAKEQVADEVSSGNVAPDAANTRLAEIMESVLYSTNQMNKVADLTHLQTDTNPLSKLVGLYSGQSQKLFNVFIQGLIEWARLRGLPDDDPQKVAAWSKVRKSFISNVIVVPLYMAGITVAWKIVRNLINGDEPDDEDYYKNMFLSSWANNTGSVVPGITAQVLQAAISMVDGQPWEDALIDFPAEETFAGTVKMFNDIYRYGAEEDPDKLNSIKDSMAYNMERSFAGWTGTPRVVTTFLKEFTTTDKDDLK